MLWYENGTNNQCKQELIYKTSRSWKQLQVSLQNRMKLEEEDWHHRQQQCFLSCKVKPKEVILHVLKA